MLQLMEGFDVFAIGDSTKRGWSVPFVSSGVGRYGGGQSMNIDVATFRALRTTTSATIFVQCGWKTTLTAGEVTVLQGYQGGSSQFAITYSITAAVFKMYRGSTAGTLIATSSPVIIPANAWQFVEAKIVIDDTVGTLTLNVNQITVAMLTGLDTKATAVNSIDAIGVGGGGLASWDDLICFDNAGITVNNFIGDQQIAPIFPMADGYHLDFIPSTGTSHFALVDETTPNVSDEVHSSLTGNIDTYEMTDVPAGSIITAIQINTACLKDASGPRKIAPVIRRGSTDYVGSNITPTLSESIQSQIFEVDPSTGSPFVLVDLNGAQLGVKVTA